MCDCPPRHHVALVLHAALFLLAVVHGVIALRRRRLHASTLRPVPDNESVLLVPLRSNAKTLLTGAPIEAVRRRLKFASLFYDRVLLESGVFRLHAGADGFSAVYEPAKDQEPPRWQTPGRRHAAEGATFAVGIGRGPVNGSSPGTIQSVISSRTSISWEATLDPFAAELPPGTDWIDFTRTRDPVGDVEQLARDWAWEDEHNAALERAIPERFVRNSVIQNADRDLVISVAGRMAASIDPLHAQVAAQRFRDDENWKLHGFAVPILFPQIGDQPWDVVADLRRDRNMTRFRSILREVEEEATAEAVGGDIEAAAQHAYRQHLSGYPEALETVGAIAHRTLTGFVIGGITGFAVSGIIGPLGPIAGAALGAATSTIIDVSTVGPPRECWRP